MTICQRRGLLAAALLLVVPAAALAHDPGLSVLDLRIGVRQVVADLSLAAADAAIVSDVRRLAANALVVRVDGQVLQGAVDEIVAEAESVVRARVTYNLISGSRLSVASTIPRQLARGHRQLLSIRNPDGAVLAQRMLDSAPTETAVDLNETEEVRSPAAYFTLGVKHILGGYDHLLFLAGLLLAVDQRREMIKVVTAFTLAHSLTLGAAITGQMQMPAVLIEPLIAASIVYVGVENLLRARVRSRWRLTFAFGLIHGFGFAGALRDLGIGARAMEVAVPLGLFNLGVEAGQLAVVALMLPLMWRLRQVSSFRARLSPVCSTVVAMAGAYWLLERTMM